METLYQDKFVLITYEESKHLLIDVWTEETEDLDEADFKKLLFTWQGYMKEKNAKFALTDTLRFRLPMTPDLQEWTVKNITLPLSNEYNYTKHAFIMPAEFIANLSIEQFTSETNKEASFTKYFADMTQARKWLLDNQ
jgi:hypothetical protein